MKRFLILLVLASGGKLFAQQSINLKDCIAYGLENHRSVHISENNIAKTKEQKREALAGYLPQLNVNGEYDYNAKLQTTLIPAGVFSDVPTKLQMGSPYGSSLIAQLDQPIFNEALLLGIKANRPATELSMLNKEQTSQQIIYNIAAAYYQVLVIQKQIDLLQINKARTEKLYGIMQLQAQQGVGKKINAKQIEVNLNNIVSQIENANSNYTLVLNRLKNAMGMELNKNIVLTDTSRWLNIGYVPAKDADFNYSNTVSYKIQQKQIELNEINAKSIRAGYLPTLSLFGRYGFTGLGQTAGKVFSNQFDFSTIGLKFSIPLLDGFKKNSQYKQVKIDISNAQENLKLNEAAQNLAFNNAASKEQQALTTLTSNKRTMAMAQELYDNVNLQYKNGTSTLSDLLNVESSWTDAQNNYIQSLINYYIAGLDVKNAKGTLGNFYNKL